MGMDEGKLISLKWGGETGREINTTHLHVSFSNATNESN